jgi:hypothetical protein
VPLVGRRWTGCNEYPLAGAPLTPCYPGVAWPPFGWAVIKCFLYTLASAP